MEHIEKLYIKYVSNDASLHKKLMINLWYYPVIYEYQKHYEFLSQAIAKSSLDSKQYSIIAHCMNILLHTLEYFTVRVTEHM